MVLEGGLITAIHARFVGPLYCLVVCLAMRFSVLSIHLFCLYTFPACPTALSVIILYIDVIFYVFMIF